MQGKLRWLGVAFIEFTTADGKVVLIDAWTKTDGSPTCPYETSEIDKADLVLVTHDHFDHVASAAAVCKHTGALLGGPDETIKRIMQEEGIQPEQVVNGGAGYLTGGTTDLGWVKVVATPAIHTSKTSLPTGVIVRAADGTTIYHSGDTSLTGEMEIYARLYPIDVAILPIYGIATMDGLQATEAVRLTKAKKVMPIHFDFCADPQKVLADFVRLCRERIPDVEVLIPEPGSSFEL